MSFFALPSKQGPVQGRFKPTHRPISLSTKVAACVRRFETPNALNHGRTESKKDISMLFSPVSFLGGKAQQRISSREHLPDGMFVFRKIPANDRKVEAPQDAGVTFPLKEKFK
jgi:hypothetical protein